MIIPCIAIDTEICAECEGIGRKELKIYPNHTPWIDIMVDKEGQCGKCKGKGWNVVHHWRYAELLN